MQMKRMKLIHWAATILFVLPLTWSAILYFTESPGMVETMTHLGYPLYFLKILGTAKLLGVAALLFDRLKLLKEWRMRDSHSICLALPGLTSLREIPSTLLWYRSDSSW
jgi:hypothetical protein